MMSVRTTAVAAGRMKATRAALRLRGHRVLRRIDERPVRVLRQGLHAGVALVVTLAVGSTADAHRSGGHRWHSCPSAHGTYGCGDLGHCSQCPDNDYCEL